MNDKWTDWMHLAEKLEIPTKTTLLEEGKVAKTLFFIEKGCLRTWVNNNGQEITAQFFFEGDRVASIENFMSGQPSHYSIESLEPSTVYAISQEDLQKIIKNSPEIEKEIQEHIFKRLLQTQKLFFSFLKNTPQQRYQELLQQHPEIILRIPQHYIASYLGITPVSLSRIRNRR